MRRIATQSARLASTSPSHQSSRLIRPRIPHWQRVRTLHTTSSRLSSSAPRVPPPDSNGNPENRSLEEQQKEREREAAVRQAFGGGDGDGGEVRRLGGGMRRTLRRRVSEVPRPPELPGWFLKGNVELCAPESEGRGEEVRDLRFVERESGEEVFRVVGVPVPKEEVEGEGKKEEAEGEVKKKMEEQEAKKKEERDKKASIPGINMLESNFFQQKFDGVIPPVLVPSGSDLPLGFRIPPSREEEGMQHDPLTWAFLETEASARAAMSVSASTGGVSSHAASRADIHLHCPDSNAHEQMDQYVRDLASVLRADLIRLDANDFADLTDDYVGGSNDAPGSFSTLGYEVFDGATATGVGIRGSRPGNAPFEHSEPENSEEEEDEEDESAHQGIDLGHFESMDDLRKTLHERRHELGKMLGGGVGGIAGISIGMPGGGNPFVPAGNFGKSPQEKKADRDYVQWDDARLTALLDHVLEAPNAKREAKTDVWGLRQAESHPSSALRPEGEESMSWSRRAASALVDVFDKIGRAKDGEKKAMKVEVMRSEAGSGAESPRRTIVHIRDLKEITLSRLGEAIVRRFVRVVQKRRRAGEQVMIIGTTSQDVQGPLDGLLDASEDSPFRLTVVPPLFGMSQSERNTYDNSAAPIPTRTIAQPPSYGRIMEINFRHIRSMLLRLGQAELDTNAMEESLKQLRIPGTSVLSERVLAQDQVQRLVLTAIGLRPTYAQASKLTPAHIALATAVLSRADHAVHSWQGYRDRQNMRSSRSMGFGSSKNASDPSSEQSAGQAHIESLKKGANAHETRLMTGVVDPANIKIGFADVHATPETIEALKSLTTLSLLRPDAFKYGVLANDRLTGLLLYGPPGTGKTLLAKAVAKESQATVLEVSGAQIYEKYVGEGEKMVRAVFSLAKKLSPCVVFIDEADAIFGSRGGGSGSRNTHREIINQFLREWDGMDDNGVFMMVASNRPFDLDDAVLRRLPRRLLVDLPVAKDRESILGIHLRHEILDSSISLSKLAEQTPLYSGSDLKNLCVSAALDAVREENELVAAKKDDKDFKLPERRTLTEKHFEKAVQEISASISEDMGSLTAIRKFDEQFGDRRGRKKKSGYGFGTGSGEVDENAARVRGGL